MYDNKHNPLNQKESLQCELYTHHKQSVEAHILLWVPPLGFEPFSLTSTDARLHQLSYTEHNTPHISSVLSCVKRAYRARRGREATVLMGAIKIKIKKTDRAGAVLFHNHISEGLSLRTNHSSGEVRNKRTPRRDA